MFKKASFIALLNVFALLSECAWALKEDAMIANGQGISSPSYWNALDGENPAGLVQNRSINLRIGAGSYSSSVAVPANSPQSSYSYGTGSLLIGNGLLGAGLEFRNYGNYFGSMSVAKINWGIAGRIQSLMSTFGISAHTTLNGSKTSYDLGALVEPVQKLKIAFMLPNIRNLQTFTGGVTYLFNDALDLVVDADYNSITSSGMFKPGASYHFDRLQISAAFGFRYLGTTDVILTKGFTGGLGAKIFTPLLFSYEYCGGPDHRLGLTLRFN